MKRNKRKGMKKAVAFCLALSMTASLSFSALAADTGTGTGDGGGELVIVSVTCDNDVTSTGAFSTVTSVTYTYNGETETVEVEIEEDETRALTLVVDGAQVDLTEGAAYTVEDSFEIVDTVVYTTGGPSSPPWEGLSSEEGSVYYFRQALLIDDSTVVADGSVTAAITGGTYDDEGAEGITVTSLGAHFNGIYVTGDSTYTLTDITVYAYGDGGDDFSGWGAAIMTDSDAVVTITGAYIETAGTIRTAIWVGGNSVTTVTDSVIYAQETEDDYATYSALLPAMMKRVPFALGMEGTIRATNVLGAGQGIYKNSIIVSTGWGALSTDSGSSYETTGTYALDVSDSLAGIGTLYANDGEGYATEEAALAAAGDTDNLVVAKEINGVYYALEVTGSGYVTYADAGVMNYYTDVEFYSPDYVQILASSTSSSTYESSYLYSERIAFMTQQAGGGTLTLIDSTVETTDALLQIKSGAANTGYTDFVIDNTTVTFSGDSVRTESGILVELVESDDAGNPGVTSYTISDTGEDAELTSSSITDSNATLSNGEYTGDIWNSIYNYYQALNVTLENADLTGTVSSSVAVHVDPETGDVVENGTVLYAYTGSEEGDVANYLDSAYGTTGDYLIIGSFSHTANEVINNPINLTIDADSTWTVTGTGYLNSLTVETLESIDAGEAVTIYTGALTVAGEEQADGTYTAGNVTIVVEAIENETEDTGVVAASQTYNNVAYTFYAVMEDGTYNSASVEVTTQNQPDGTVTGTIAATDGYSIVSVEPTNAEITLDGEAFTLTPAGTDEITVVITVAEGVGTADSGELEIVSVTSVNDVTSTGALSTVTSVTYTYNGETATVDAENDVLTLVVDGAQVDLTEGAAYTVEESFEIADTVVYATGGPSSPPWEGLSSEEGSVYYFRQALLIDDSTVVADGSVTAAITGGTYDDEGAEGITVTSLGAHFNGIYVTGDSTYTLTDITVYAYGDGGDDFSGWGAAIMTDSDAVVTITGAYIETAGTIRTAIWVGGNSVTTVTDSVIYAQETEDDYATYSALLPAMMKRVPFALGMEGTIRATNVLGAGQGIYVNSMIVSTGWGALSTDSGSSYATTGTYALDVSDSLAGIGTLYANDGEGYATEEAALAAAGDTDNLVVAKEIDGVYYALEVTGSGYVTYADAGVMNYYTDVEFYSPDYVQILASGLSSSTYESSYLYSERIAFMTQQAGGGTLTLIDSEVYTTDALLQIKSGAANTGYTNFEIDNTTVTFSGDSVRTESGILIELVESDDAGNPGVTSYTINDVGDEAELTADAITDSNATLSNGTYTGDIWNSIYNNYQALNVTLENADLTGTVSSSVAVHVDPETGEVVENGTVLYAYTGSEEGDVANYLDSAYGTTGDYLIIGSFSHTASEVLNNPINLTIDEDSTWTVTGTGYLNTLTVDTLESIDAEEAVTIYTGALTIAGEEQEDGTYTAGNVTIVVEEIVNDAEDTGIAASGQTYNNVPYTFYSVLADGTSCSIASDIATVNQPDGTVWFTLEATTGYEIVSIDVAGAALSEDDSHYTLTPDGSDEIIVTITVQATGTTGTTGVTGLANLGDGWALYADSVVVDYTGLVYNDKTYGGQAGWYYVVNGYVDFSYTGLVKYDGASNGIKAGAAGWYFVQNGHVDFTYTGLVKYTANSKTGGGVTGWYYVKNAYVDFTYTGLVKYTASSKTGGGVTGWYYVKNAYADFTYNGLASNAYGTWYVKAGNVKFSYSGTYTTGGTTYTIKSGKLVG